MTTEEMMDRQFVPDTIDEFKAAVRQELGYVSAIFMSQECSGTEIVMPTKELLESADKICALAEELKLIK